MNTIFKNILFIFIAIVSLLIAAEYKIKQLLKSEKEIPTPNLIGLDILNAFEKIDKINQNLKKSIKIEVIPILNDHPLKYIVVKQYPYPKNLTIKEGQTIQLMISKGNLTPKIPNYVGLPIEKVKKNLLKNFEQYYVKQNIKEHISTILSKKISYKDKIFLIKNLIHKKKSRVKNYYLNIGTIHFEYNNSFKKGIIIKQSIPENYPIYKDLKINFIVSKGKKHTFKIANYTGKTIHKIYPLLRKNKIFTNIRNVSNPNTSLYKDGDIVYQSLPANYELPYYEEIDLNIVSNEYPEFFHRCIQFEIPNFENSTDENYSVKFFLKDKNYSLLKKIFSNTQTIYEPIFFCTKIPFHSSIFVYINDIFFKKYSS